MMQDPIIYYCQRGPLNMVQQYLPETPEPRCCDYEVRRFIPLHTAVYNHHNAIARWLINTEASSVNFCVPRNQSTALHVAVYRKNNDMVSYLISNGANVNCVDKWGKTPLIHAVYHNNLNAVRLLLHAPDIDINIRDNYGFTAFYSTVDEDVKKMFKNWAVQNGLMVEEKADDSCAEDINERSDNCENQNPEENDSVSAAFAFS